MDRNNFNNIVLPLCCGIVFVSVDGARLTSVSNFGPPLYDRLIDHRGKPINEDPRIRERVCEDIGASGLFQLVGLNPVDARVIYDNRNQEKYARVYRFIYSNLYYQYVNPYYTWKIRSSVSESAYEEHVFVCPFENVSDHSLRVDYVTKEYHVGPADKPYKPGRFIFGRPLPGTQTIHLLLAEEPAVAYGETGSEFNVELYYLRLREHVKPAESNSLDPLCKLIGGGRHHDQHLRFCTAIIKSAYFVNNARYPIPPIASENRCQSKQVSFNTLTGMEKANGKLFYERMVLCRSTYLDTHENISLYVSRAYMSNQVFVYFQDLIDGRIYLENLSTNIAVIDELDSFDLPEA